MMKPLEHEKRTWGWVVGLAALLLAVFVASFGFGRYGVAPGQVVRILLSRVFPIAPDWTPQMETAVLNIRLPRILLACLVGCSLASAGASYQGVFQNPMAAPDILGASSGAAFGAALAILMGFGSRGIMACAFVMGLATVLLVYLIGQRAPGRRAIGMVLAGIMIGSLFSAGTSFVKLVADPSNQLPAITYWLMGSLSGTTMRDVWFAVLPMAAGLVPLFLLRWRINLLTLGDDEARSMGVNVRLLRFAVVVCSTLVTAASVAVSGMIGWVGLVIPHLGRMMVGSDYRRLMPASMLLGASFLLLVDDVSRNLLATEIPIGILTAFIGAPFFLYFILRKEDVQ
ncbi:MAG TPA: iron ABC transporter permease [Clostridia bacterium]|nr:iron ABC transporter permease [Clostridia bacterium]